MIAILTVHLGKFKSATCTYLPTLAIGTYHEIKQAPLPIGSRLPQSFDRHRSDH